MVIGNFILFVVAGLRRRDMSVYVHYEAQCKIVGTLSSHPASHSREKNVSYSLMLFLISLVYRYYAGILPQIYCFVLHGVHGCDWPGIVALYVEPDFENVGFSRRRSGCREGDEGLDAKL